MADPAWRAFELAVAQVLSAFAPDAQVRHDVQTPDRDTGLPRQRDVWIEAPLLGGLATLRVHVSCKRKKSKLSQLDIDAFLGELASSGASIGMIFSHEGFTKPALAKAAKRGIGCCALFEDRPADLPDVLALEIINYRERVRIESRGIPRHSLAALAEAQLPDDPEGLTVLQRLLLGYESERQDSMASPAGQAPPKWFSELSFGSGTESPASLRLSTEWGVFRARREACLLNGAYSFTEQTFAGVASTPWIDQRSAHPGPGWEEVDAAEVEASVGLRLAIFSHGGELESGLREYLQKESTAEE